MAFIPLGHFEPLFVDSPPWEMLEALADFAPGTPPDQGFVVPMTPPVTPPVDAWVVSPRHPHVTHGFGWVVALTTDTGHW